MDGKGSWRDNVFVERLWRRVKYEEVYLKPMPASAKRAPRWGSNCPNNPSWLLAPAGS
jgi:hypothetical protein